MFRKFLVTLLGAALIIGTSAAQPPKGKDAPKKGDAPKEAPKTPGKKDASKKEAPKAPPKTTDKPKAPTPGKEVSGMFKTKDIEKNKLVVTIDGKDKTFNISKDTKFTGPRGGESDDRLKDDRLDKGYKIAVIPDAGDDSAALEVKLPFRNAREGNKKPVEKKKG